LRAALLAVGPVLVAVATAAWVDLRTRRARLDPPGFADPLRRWAWLVVLGGCLWIAVFAALGNPPGAGEIDLAAVSRWQLFALHAILAATLLAWYALGFGGRAGAAAAPTSLARQVGLAARSPLTEIGVGLVFGVGAWLVVLAGVVVVALAVAALGGEELLPQQPPAMIPWLAGQPIALRLAIALSAGTVEEVFFRGLLQPRAGIALSTALFALAHAAYGEPFLLVGVTLLSLLYAGLVRWRQSVWAAIAAHALFDAVQLLVVIPSVLEVWGGAAGGD
jgi:membrane protease YdiL (CAAX protease family)